MPPLIALPFDLLSCVEISPSFEPTHKFPSVRRFPDTLHPFSCSHFPCSYLVPFILVSLLLTSPFPHYAHSNTLSPHRYILPSLLLRLQSSTLLSTRHISELYFPSSIDTVPPPLSSPPRQFLPLILPTSLPSPPRHSLPLHHPLIDLFPTPTPISPLSPTIPLTTPPHSPSLLRLLLPTPNSRSPRPLILRFSIIPCLSAPLFIPNPNPTLPHVRRVTPSIESILSRPIHHALPLLNTPSPLLLHPPSTLPTQQNPHHNAHSQQTHSNGRISHTQVVHTRQYEAYLECAVLRMRMEMARNEAGWRREMELS